MESPNSSKEFEITGVSRSGRVRKKSSKLLDFRSPDDIEPKAKKGSKITSKVQHKPSSDPVQKSSHDMAESDEGFDTDEIETSGNNIDSEEELQNVDMEDDVDDSDENSGDHTVNRSLYMTEKSNKKKIYKDGKVVMEKTQRKDKGKSRFTAYMLWARDVRKNVLSKNTSSDFGNTSRKLGEMWANVPPSEKSMWRRRAKRLASKTKQINIDENKQQQSKSTFINRATTSRTKKIAQQSTSSSSVSSVKANSPTEIQSPVASSIFSSNTKFGTNAVPQAGAFKVTGIEPIDVAAHLKLLGDSLTIIGERLKEHEGQITVSGSLSVLLDSLLCSLGPLLCLSIQIPGLESRKDLNDNLHATLDNIAYVMPGL